jgi:hypothetical protein
VTIAKRPSEGRDGGIYTTDLSSEKQKYFCKRGWTANSLICPSGKSVDLVDLGGLSFVAVAVAGCALERFATRSSAGAKGKIGFSPSVFRLA